MKRIIILILPTIIFFSCSKEEKKLEVFSPEAFAYSMEPGWELNASARIKGYDQKENNGSFEMDIDYWVDLVKADGDTVKNVFKGYLKDKNPESQPDIQMNAQIELDSTYAPGNYSLIFRAVDNLSGKKTSAAAKFDLSEE